MAFDYKFNPVHKRVFYNLAYFFGDVGLPKRKFNLKKSILFICFSIILSMC